MSRNPSALINDNTYLRVKFDSVILKQIFSIIRKYISRYELAKRLGINVSTLKRWRSGKNTIPLSQFDKLSSMYPILENYKEKGLILNSNWGQQIGGKSHLNRISELELKEKMKFVRSHRKKIKEMQVDLKDPFVLEFIGAMIGDGCLSRYKNYGRIRNEIVISGNSIKDYSYFVYLTKSIHETFGIKTKIYKRKSSNTIDIKILNSPLFIWLSNHGFPIGKKGQIAISHEIMGLSNQDLNHVIRGIFDTDGHISSRKGEGYKYPSICLTSISKPLRNQLISILRNQDFPAYVHDQAVFVRGAHNFKRWFNLIGSNNDRNLKKYNEYLLTGKIVCVGL